MVVRLLERDFGGRAVLVHWREQMTHARAPHLNAGDASIMNMSVIIW